MTAPSARDLLRCATPFLDVRAPGEVERGTIPGAVNLPILDDDERSQVGRTYKQSGQDAAERLGYQLVSGPVREARVATWLEFARRHPTAWIFCWRGGQRSEIAQRWLGEAGTRLPRVPGGFKALRRVCLDILEEAPSRMRWFVLGGRTGSGKTRLLNTLDNSIDLEGLAQHRGSAFGAMETTQPSPVTFENTLATSVLANLSVDRVVRTGWSWRTRVEPSVVWPCPNPGTSRCSARLWSFWRFRWKRAAPTSSRNTSPNLCPGACVRISFKPATATPLLRIERRLGGERRLQVQAALETGFAREDHQPWVEMLLNWYYDPMYDYQLSRKGERIVLRGEWKAVQEFLAGC